MHKDIDPKDFEGKTIKKLVANAVNVIEFYFTDGTSITIEVEGMGGGLMGMVACTTCTQSKRNQRAQYAIQNPQIHLDTSRQRGVGSDRSRSHRRSNKAQR